MVKIICRAVDCIFWENGLCTSDEITYDPDEGCLTYEVIDDVLNLEDDQWIDDDDAEDDLDSIDLYDDDDDLDLYEDDDTGPDNNDDW